MQPMEPFVYQHNTNRLMIKDKGLFLSNPVLGEGFLSFHSSSSLQIVLPSWLMIPPMLLYP